MLFSLYLLSSLLSTPSLVFALEMLRKFKDHAPLSISSRLPNLNELVNLVLASPVVPGPIGMERRKYLQGLGIR